MWRTIGQEMAVAVLGKSLESGQLAHAYLFTGPAGVGKMTLAIDLARALNCGAPEPPCGRCPSCVRIEQGKHADVQVLKLNPGDSGENTRNKAEIGVEQVKQLQHLASLPPFEGKCRVFIIDGADLVSTEAANRMLKTLEEPESRVVFVLLALTGAGVLETVASRCQRLDLQPMPVEKIKNALIGSGIDREKARLLAGLCRGCYGWALTAAGDEGFLEQHRLKRDTMFDIINSDTAKRFDHAARMAAAFSQKRQTVIDELDLWLGLWHDILLLKTGCPESVINIDIRDRLSRLAGDYSLAEIKACTRSIREASARLGLNASPRLVLDVLMLDLPAGEREQVGGAAGV